MKDNGYVMTAPGITGGVLWADSQEQAEADTLAAAEDAGFIVEFCEFVVRRAPEYDNYRGIYRTYDHPVVKELVDRDMRRLAGVETRTTEKPTDTSERENAR